MPKREIVEVAIRLKTLCDKHISAAGNCTGCPLMRTHHEDDWDCTLRYDMPADWNFNKVEVEI